MAAHVSAPDRYQKMPYRRCGRSGLKLPVISLGFWQSLGEPGNEELCRKCMYYAFDHGVTHFDLANNYGPPPGDSERVVGQILKDMPRDELIVSTKAGWWMWDGPYGDWGSKKYLVASLDQSLQRLGLDYVDIFYHHRPDPETPLDETLGALDLIVKQGKALYAGVSSYSGEQFYRAVETVRRHDWAPITIHQPYYSMLERRVEWDLLPQTAMAGTGVIAFCPLAQGVLTDRYLNGLPPDSRRGKSRDGQRWYEEQKAKGVWDKVTRLNEVAKARGQTLAQMALTWLLRDERVTSVLIGASKLEQLAENLGAAQAAPLSAEELQTIDAILGAGQTR
jgi:L-glyceraldehyde 3-phosphate reductase